MERVRTPFRAAGVLGQLSTAIRPRSTLQFLRLSPRDGDGAEAALELKVVSSNLFFARKSVDGGMDLAEVDARDLRGVTGEGVAKLDEAAADACLADLRGVDD
jgi:hypothetical protein